MSSPDKMSSPSSSHNDCMADSNCRQDKRSRSSSSSSTAPISFIKNDDAHSWKDSCMTNLIKTLGDKIEIAQVAFQHQNTYMKDIADTFKFIKKEHKRHLSNNCHAGIRTATSSSKLSTTETSEFFDENQSSKDERQSNTVESSPLSSNSQSTSPSSSEYHYTPSELHIDSGVQTASS